MGYSLVNYCYMFKEVLQSMIDSYKCFQRTCLSKIEVNTQTTMAGRNFLCDRDY